MGEHTILDGSLKHAEKFPTRPVLRGDRWECIRCGSCCRNDFEEDWLKSLIPEYVEEVCHGFCPYAIGYDELSLCLRYRGRPNACKAFPFTLKANADGRYNLVLHARCQGFGKGEPIDARKKITEIVKYSNREYKRKNKAIFSQDPQDDSITLARK